MPCLQHLCWEAGLTTSPRSASFSVSRYHRRSASDTTAPSLAGCCSRPSGSMTTGGCGACAEVPGTLAPLPAAGGGKAESVASQPPWRERSGSGARQRGSSAARCFRALARLPLPPAHPGRSFGRLGLCGCVRKRQRACVWSEQAKGRAGKWLSWTAMLHSRAYAAGWAAEAAGERALAGARLGSLSLV